MSLPQYSCGWGTLPSAVQGHEAIQSGRNLRNVWLPSLSQCAPLLSKFILGVSFNRTAVSGCFDIKNIC